MRRRRVFPRDAHGVRRDIRAHERRAGEQPAGLDQQRAAAAAGIEHAPVRLRPHVPAAAELRRADDGRRRHRMDGGGQSALPVGKALVVHGAGLHEHPRGPLRQAVHAQLKGVAGGVVRSAHRARNAPDEIAAVARVLPELDAVRQGRFVARRAEALPAALCGRGDGFRLRLRFAAGDQRLQQAPAAVQRADIALHHAHAARNGLAMRAMRAQLIEQRFGKASRRHEQQRNWIRQAADGCGRLRREPAERLPVRRLYLGAMLLLLRRCGRGRRVCKERLFGQRTADRAERQQHGGHDEARLLARQRFRKRRHVRLRADGGEQAGGVLARLGLPRPERRMDARKIACLKRLPGRLFFGLLAQRGQRSGRGAPVRGRRGLLQPLHPRCGHSRSSAPAALRISRSTSSVPSSRASCIMLARYSMRFSNRCATASASVSAVAVS